MLTPLVATCLLILLDPIVTAQFNYAYCGTPETRDCRKGQICVKPAPTVRCASDKIATCPGICKPACALDKASCPFGLPCSKPTYPISQSQLGFCPDLSFCGGFTAVKCENANDVCIDDPRDDCDPKKGGTNCGGICVPSGQQCGAKTGKNCPKGYDCAENTWDDCDPKKGSRDCPGICLRKPQTEHFTDQTCGGITGKLCQKGYRCADNPKDGCNPETGGADCSGLCVKKQICATIKGIQCPDGQTCVDDNDGDCKGGIAADCPGVCVGQ